MSTWIELKNNPRIAEIYRQRAVIIHLIRDFFWSRDFVETDTPVAVKLPGQEPYLNPVPVELHDPRSESYRFYLQTSPEFAMKKLLAAGWPKIFQICKCFRDYEDFGGRHNTEFTMIEWYRAPGNLSEIMDDTENLFKFVGARLGVNKIKYKEREINIEGIWERRSMKEIWQKLVGVNLDEYLELPAMGELVKKLGL
ncbi:MAG TPA: amino acid--tRNA ligase-related protein, partial [Patescibacteria group bacterium]|nr:amino acid--tRNA ligase-related protein [Patescibacteria group bacterium]